MNFLPYLEAAGWVVAGILVVIGLFNRQTKQNRKDDDETASNLISNLKTTVDLQEKTINSLNAKMEITNKELHQMQGRNSVLESLFNGNENSILAFLKQAPKLLEIAEDNNKLTKENFTATTNLTTAIAELVKKMPTTK